MADFERKLTMLAERSTPVGPEEMIERVEAQMAADPLVVVTMQRKGWEMSVDIEERETTAPRRRGLLVATAAFVLVIAIGAVFLIDQGGGGTVEPVATTTSIGVTSTTLDPRVAADLAVIDEYLVSWFGGDVERAFEMLGADPTESPGSADSSRYEGLMNAEVSAQCGAQVATAGTYDCEVSHESDLHRAVGAEPDVLMWSARIDGETVEVLGLEGQRVMSDSWHAWQNETLRTADSPCTLGPPNPDCAAYQQDNIQEWATWYAENN